MTQLRTTILSGCAPYKGFIFYAKEVDEVANADTPNSTFLSYDDQNPNTPICRYDEAVGWPAISMATVMPGDDPRVVVAIGPNGDSWEGEPESMRETVGAIPNFKGNLRKLSVVEHTIYACGMNRVVLRRESLGRWSSLGPGEQVDDPPVVGFEDLAGFNVQEMYAVGWGGELWWRDRGSWRRIDSPTSLNLNALVCADDEWVYVAGHEGVMLRGRHDRWAIVETGRKENLLDVAYYDGNLYACTAFRILRYVNGALINDDDFADPIDRPYSCLHLLAAADGLISLGQKDVFVRDAGPWRRLAL